LVLSIESPTQFIDAKGNQKRYTSYTIGLFSHGKIDKAKDFSCKKHNKWLSKYGDWLRSYMHCALRESAEEADNIDNLCSPECNRKPTLTPETFNSEEQKYIRKSLGVRDIQLSFTCSSTKVMIIFDKDCLKPPQKKIIKPPSPESDTVKSLSLLEIDSDVTVKPEEIIGLLKKDKEKR